MAQVPTVSGPSVQPNAGPSPLQSINAPAEAFGANVAGQGLQEVAKAAGVTGDELYKYAQQKQAIANKVTADAANLQTITGLGDFESDFYKTHQGALATPDALASAYAKMEAIRKAPEAGMSPLALVEYQANSRRMMGYTAMSLSRYVTTQQEQTQKTIFEANQNALSSDSVVHPDHLEANMAQIVHNQGAYDQLHGVPPEQAQEVVRKLWGQEVSKVAQARAGMGDPDGGMAILNKYKDNMDGTLYADTLMRLHPAVQANTLATIGTQAADTAIATGHVPASSISAAIAGQEWSGKGPAPTSANGAVGPSQIKPATAVEYGLDPTKLHDPAYAQFARETIISKIAADPKVNGDPARIAVAYFSGIGNVAPPGSPTPYIHDYKDKPRKSVSSYVSDIQSRLAGSNTGNINGTPTSYDMQGSIETARNLATQAAQAKGMDAQGQQQAASNAEAEMRRRIGAQKGNEDQAFQTLTAPLTDPTHSIVTMDQLFKTVPGGLQLYSALPYAQRKQVENAVSGNANAWTPARETNNTSLVGMWSQRYTNPAFTNQDISAMDLTLAEKHSWMTKQAQFKSRGAGHGDPGSEINHILSDPTNTDAIAQLGFGPSTNPTTHYWQFLGELQSQMDAISPAGAKLTPEQSKVAFNKAYAAMVRQGPTMMTVIPGTNIEVGKRQPGAVTWQGLQLDTPDTRNSAIALLRQQGIPATEENIIRQINAGPRPLEY